MARLAAGVDAVIYLVDDVLSDAVCWVADVWCALRHNGGHEEG